jgi:hypothetical protein
MAGPLLAAAAEPVSAVVAAAEGLLVWQAASCNSVAAAAPASGRRKCIERVSGVSPIKVRSLLPTQWTQCWCNFTKKIAGMGRTEDRNKKWGEQVKSFRFICSPHLGSDIELSQCLAQVADSVRIALKKLYAVHNARH